MMQSVTEIDMRDFRIALPAVLTILAIPLTFSIAEGIGLGPIAAALLAIGLGQPKRLTILGYVIAAVFFAQFFHLLALPLIRASSAGHRRRDPRPTPTRGLGPRL
jgi:AGZA family xanthine/uracil permease-like MFS transporter